MSNAAMIIMGLAVSFFGYDLNPEPLLWYVPVLLGMGMTLIGIVNHYSE